MIVTRTRKIVTAALPFVVIVLLWQFASAETGPRAIFLPTPFRVLRELRDLFFDQGFVRDIAISIYRVSVGFLLAAIVAVPFGLLAGTSRLADLLIQPINDFTRYLPVPSLIPLFILWVGIGDPEKIVVIFVGTVFQVIPLVADTARSVPREFVDLALVSGAGKWSVLRGIVWPWSAPAVYDELRVALGWAWSYLVIAELVAAESGIGHVIIQAQRFIQTGRVMAGIVTIGLVGLMFDQLFRLPRRRLFPWT
jgi:NitT/TauT family transport system permease protein